MKLSDYEQRAIQRFGQTVLDGQWSKHGLVSLLKVIINNFLQLKRVSNYAKQNNRTTQGLRNNPDIIKIDGIQMIIDCD